MYLSQHIYFHRHSQLGICDERLRVGNKINSCILSTEKIVKKRHRAGMAIETSFIIAFILTTTFINFSINSKLGFIFCLVSFGRVQNTHHKFMRASYMKHFAKFLAILHHNASFFNFCFIINFGFNKNLLHIFEILKNYCCLCLRSLYCWLSLPKAVRFSIIFGSTQMQIICYYNAWLGKWKVNNYSFKVVWQWTKIAAPNTSFFV